MHTRATSHRFGTTTLFPLELFPKWRVIRSRWPRAVRLSRIPVAPPFPLKNQILSSRQGHADFGQFERVHDEDRDPPFRRR
jgi:hypothetical protein